MITPRNPDVSNVSGCIQSLADDINTEIGNTFTIISANGAVDKTATKSYVITKAGIAALTLAAPTSDGVRITITSNTAFAHTLTATGLLQTGSASVNVATFAAFAGARLNLRSYGGKWFADGSGITFS